MKNPCPLPCPLAIALEILRCFRRHGVPAVEQPAFWRPQWLGNSQYGFAMTHSQDRKTALRFVLSYYATRMHLIRQ